MMITASRKYNTGCSDRFCPPGFLNLLVKVKGWFKKPFTMLIFGRFHPPFLRLFSQGLMFKTNFRKMIKLSKGDSFYSPFYHKNWCIYNFRYLGCQNKSEHYVMRFFCPLGSLQGSFFLKSFHNVQYLEYYAISTEESKTNF